MVNENPPAAPAHKSGVWGWMHHQFRTNVLNLSFWLGLTLGFPVEHFLWEHVWPFKLITKWLGL